MSDEGMAARIRKSVVELNNALTEAAEAGISVQLFIVGPHRSTNNTELRQIETLIHRWVQL